MPSNAIEYTQDGKIARIKIDDGNANALTYDLVDTLIHAVTRAEHEATAILLHGRPGQFCGGFDPDALAAGPEAAHRVIARTSELVIRLYSTHLPVVIACTGNAIAAGALIVLTGDLRIGAEGAFKIGFDEITHGTAVPVLGVELARARLATNELETALTASYLYDFAHAQRAGFLDAVAPAADLVARAGEATAALGARGGDAFAATKQRVRGKTIDLMR